MGKRIGNVKSKEVCEVPLILSRSTKNARVNDPVKRGSSMVDGQSGKKSLNHGGNQNEVGGQNRSLESVSEGKLGGSQGGREEDK